MPARSNYMHLNIADVAWLQKDMTLNNVKRHVVPLEIAEGIDCIEQERYYSRLNVMNKKQNAIFEGFMKNYYIPQRQVEEQK